MDSLGLYISVPFCKAKCSFCNFASDAFSPGLMAQYVERLCGEIVQARAVCAEGNLRLPERVDSVFIGGGTPSLLEPQQIHALFAALRASFDIDPAAEISVEAAPGQISDAVLDALLVGGTNRISLGVQSFIDKEASAVGRQHTGAGCIAEIWRLRAAGVRNLNIDLIAGLPYQTAASWRQSLQEAQASGAEHVSVYMLEVDEDSRLGKELIGPGVRYGAHAAPTESAVAEFYAEACDFLNAAGLPQYEISNFAREGYRSRHNCKYWTRAPYLGFGLDAHSMIHDARTGAAVRFANGDDLQEYLSTNAPMELEQVDPLSAWEETVFLGLRLVEGLSIARLRSEFPSEWVDALLSRSRELEQGGLMTTSDESVALTAAGRIVSSSIFGELLTADAFEAEAATV